MGKCLIQTGKPGAGKTTFTKKRIEKWKGDKLIFDPNKEYGVEYMSMPNFLEEAKTRKNTLIVFEEATIFFKAQGVNPDIVELLVKRRHDNNFYILNFHALAQVPLYILAFADYFNVFKTIDQQGQVERKFKGNASITNAFNTCRLSTNKHINILLDLSKG